MMRSIGIFGTTALFLLLGFGPTANARRQDKPEDKPRPTKEEAAKPEKQQPEAKAPKQEQQAKPEKQQQQQTKAPKQEQPAKSDKQQQTQGQQEQRQKQQQEQAKSNKQQTQHSQQQVKAQQEQPSRKATSSNGPQRTQEETATQQAQPELRLTSRGSGRIPDERFRSHFGRGHEFRMGNPVMVDGYSRFQYGGYWFGYVQRWPTGWFYTDQFYIDYVDGGYYMYDPYYPGSRFAITVVI